MSITIYILCYNEELMLPHTLAWYRSKFPSCRIVVVDNQSNDNTLHFAFGNGCEVINFDTGDKLSDLNFQHIKNNYWKHAVTDWVAIVDCDEWLCINEEELGIEERRGCTLIRSEAYHMINMEDNLDVASITHGVRAEPIFYDKCLLFNRTQIQEINYNVGAHAVRPVGNVKFTDGVYRMLHYKYISPEYLINRYRVYAERMSEENKKNSFGGQFLSTEEQVRNEFASKRALATKIL